MTPPCLFSSTSPRHSTLLTVEFCWRDCKSCSVSAAFTTAAVCLQCRRSSRVLRKEVGAHNSTSPWGVGGSCAEHLTVESYTIIISLQSYFYYWYSITHSLFHSRLKSFLFCKSSLPQPFLFLIQVSLYGFPRLFTVTSEHIRLFTF